MYNTKFAFLDFLWKYESYSNFPLEVLLVIFMENNANFVSKKYGVTLNIQSWKSTKTFRGIVTDSYAKLILRHML